MTGFASLLFIHFFLVQTLKNCWESLANCAFPALSQQQLIFGGEAHPAPGASLKLLGIDGFSQALSQLSRALPELATWLLPIKPYICCINTTVPI